jgi:hypothetical protein
LRWRKKHVYRCDILLQVLVALRSGDWHEIIAFRQHPRKCKLARGNSYTRRQLLDPGDEFFHTWRSAGFRIVGHLVFRKQYASKSRFFKYQHEQTYLLAKGNPALPEDPITNVLDMPYSGNSFIRPRSQSQH